MKEEPDESHEIRGFCWLQNYIIFSRNMHYSFRLQTTANMVLFYYILLNIGGALWHEELRNYL